MSLGKCSMFVGPLCVVCQVVEYSVQHLCIPHRGIDRYQRWVSGEAASHVESFPSASSRGT